MLEAMLTLILSLFPLGTPTTPATAQDSAVAKPVAGEISPDLTGDRSGAVEPDGLRFTGPETGDTPQG